MQHCTRLGGTGPDSVKYAVTMAGERDRPRVHFDPGRAGRYSQFFRHHRKVPGTVTRAVNKRHGSRLVRLRRPTPGQ